MIQSIIFEHLIDFSLDGEWGKVDKFDDSIVMKVIRGTDFESVRKGVFRDVPIRYISQKHGNRKKLQPYDIIIETAGGSKDKPTGRTLLLKKSMFSEKYPLTCASFSRFIRINPEKANPGYIFWVLQYLYKTRLLEKYHTQHTGVARFQWTTFKTNELIRLPCLEYQLKVAEFLNQFDDLIIFNTERINVLEEVARCLYREWFDELRFPNHENAIIEQTKQGLTPKGWLWKEVNDLVIRYKAGKIYRKNSVTMEGKIKVYDQSTKEFLGYHNNEPDHIASIEKPMLIFGDHTKNKIYTGSRKISFCELSNNSGTNF